MLSKRILFTYPRVRPSKYIRAFANKPESLTKAKCEKPSSSPVTLDKKYIESRYEECEQLLRIRKLRQNIQSVKDVLKGEKQLTISSARVIFIYITLLKTQFKTFTL